jgi:MFS family permease
MSEERLNQKTIDDMASEVAHLHSTNTSPHSPSIHAAGTDQGDHAYFGVDQIACMEPIGSEFRRESFLTEFSQSRGPPQIVLLIILLALGFGSTIGVVPAVMTDRYARLNHDYSDQTYCADYSMNDKPKACLLGSADAQNAVAFEQLISNIFTFFTSSLIGSLSDEYGRKGILTLGVLMSTMSPLCLLLIQLRPEMSPFWYYTVGAVQGLISWITIALSALSDVMPPKWRAPSFGLLLAGFSLGFAMAPQLALILGHFYVTVVSLFMVLSGLLIVVFFFPETLRPETAREARRVREAQVEDLSASKLALSNILRPMRELSILNRNRLFRLLSLLAFFSGLVTAGDRTLLIYYIEERLGFGDKDIATMFMIMGVLGIFVQGVVLKLLNEAIGERMVVTLCFCLGSFHNLLYGLAKDKTTIFLAVAISAFGGMAFPTISAIKANNVVSR